MPLITLPNSQKNNRLAWIDYDKGISIILVCYLHLYHIVKDNYGVNIDAYWVLKYPAMFLEGFRMGLFFMISGILAHKSIRKKGLFSYVDSRFSMIFYPLLIWGFIKITLQIASGGPLLRHGGLMLYWDLLVDPRQITPFWYLHALFCVSVVYALFKVRLKVAPNINLLIGLVLYSISAYITTHGLNVMFLGDILKYYIFFAAGDFVSDFMLSEEKRTLMSRRKVLFSLLAVFLIVQSYAMQINLKHENVFYTENMLPYLFLLQGLVGCAFSVSFSFLLQKSDPLPSLRNIGFHSLYIYCIHIIVIGMVCTLSIKILHITNVFALVGLCLAAAVWLPILIYKVSMKYNFWWLYTFRKPAEKLAYTEKITPSPAPVLIASEEHVNHMQPVDR